MMGEIISYESITKDGVFWLEICFKGLLNSVLCNDKSIKTKWIGYFEKVCQLFSVDKFINKFAVKPEAITSYSSILPKITLKIPAGLIECFQQTIIPFVDNKLTIISDNESVKEFLNRIRNRIIKLTDYLCLWKKEVMTYDRYFELRNSHEKEIKELKDKVNIYMQKQTKKEQQLVTDIVMQIENNELRKIFGGDILTFDTPLPESSSGTIAEF